MAKWGVRWNDCDLFCLRRTRGASRREIRLGGAECAGDSQGGSPLARAARTEHEHTAVGAANKGGPPTEVDGVVVEEEEAASEWLPACLPASLSVDCGGELWQRGGGLEAVWGETYSVIPLPLRACVEGSAWGRGATAAAWIEGGMRAAGVRRTWVMADPYTHTGTHKVTVTQRIICIL